jgi:cytoskeletal protein CcmA (bactofilin family)
MRISDPDSSVIKQVEDRTVGPGTEATRPESLIDKHSSFDGLYRSTHNLRVKGVADGEIDCQSTLIIDPEAKVRAKVVAQNVIVGGCLEGEVCCPGRFKILPTGRVVGTVVAGVLEIHDGAFYEGNLSMQKQESSRIKSGAESSMLPFLPVTQSDLPQLTTPEQQENP